MSAHGIVVLGAGGFGRETLDVILAHNRARPDDPLEVLGVADDAPSRENLERLGLLGVPWLGRLDDVLRDTPPQRFVIGIGAPSVKQVLDARWSSAGWTPQTVVHPSASVGSVRSIGPGSVICGGVQLSTNTLLGRHVHLNPGAIVGHDTELADHVSVNPGAIVSGDVRIGAASLIGAGAVILQGLTVGAAATVGASACVTREVSADAVVVGVPARPMRSGER